jgi:hypothetical protein
MHSTSHWVRIRMVTQLHPEKEYTPLTRFIWRAWHSLIDITYPLGTLRAPKFSSGILVLGSLKQIMIVTLTLQSNVKLA